jgi:hypothetical protein
MRQSTSLRGSTSPLLYGALTIFTIAGLSSTALAQEASAGRDKSGFFIKGENASISFSGMLQSRYTAVFRDAPGATANAEDTAVGFSVRRARLATTVALTDAIKVKVELAADNATALDLLEAYATFKLSSSTSLDVGAFKGPGMHEFHGSDGTTTFAEKSTLNTVFNQGRSDGAMITHTIETDGGGVRLRAGLNDGINTRVSEFTSTREADIAGAIRVEWTNSGKDFSRFGNLSGFRGTQPGLMLGAALHGQTGGETLGTTDKDVIQFMADATYLADGWSILGAGVYRKSDEATGDFSDWGLMSQVGYFITDTSQVAGRVAYLSPDGDRTNNDGFLEFTLGYNYFFLPSSHAHKITADITWASDQSESSGLISQNLGTGLLSSEEDQVMLRFQYQVLF